MLLTKVDSSALAVTDDDAVDASHNTLNDSNNINNTLDDINNYVVVDDSAAMSLGSTTSGEPRTEVNQNILIESVNDKKYFPVAADFEKTTTFLCTARRRRINEVEPVSKLTLKERCQTTSYQQSLMKEYRSFGDINNTTGNGQHKVFPLTLSKNKTSLLFPIEISKNQFDIIESSGNILDKNMSDCSLIENREVPRFPMVHSKSLPFEFPVKMSSLTNTQKALPVFDRPTLVGYFSKFRLSNLAKQKPFSSMKVQNNFPIRKQQQTQYVTHFPCPDIKNKTISNSRTDFNQNNPSENNNKNNNSQTQEFAQKYEEYTAIASIDDDNKQRNLSPSPPAIMTQSEISAATKYGIVRKIQVQTTKHSTNDQCESNNGSCFAEENQKQHQPFLNDAAVLPASNAKNISPEHQSYRTEYHYFNINRATSGDALLSERNIKNERLVSIRKSSAPTTITPTIGENLENLEYEEQRQHSSNNNDHLDNHHHHRKTHRLCSDERDTSSQEVADLVKEIPTTSETCPSKSLRAVSSTHQQQQTTSVFPTESTPPLDILPNLNSVPSRVERNGYNCAEVDILTDKINTRQVGDESLNEQQQQQQHQQPEDVTSENCVHKRDQVEMTVTKTSEDSEKSASILSDNQKIIIDDTIDEMKFEMKSVKGALPSVPVRSTHLRNEQDTPNVVGTRSTPSAVTSGYGSSAFSSMPSAVGSRSSSSNTSSVTSAYGSSAFSSLDLPRFGKVSSDVSLHSHEIAGGRSLSVDTVDSLLPARTRMRRQRRMFSQNSIDDQTEDPIERLNRLRARISGALTEVKGVLKQYSTETEGESQETTPITARKTEQPTKLEEEPVKFRFVRKVRRRSVFDEADEDKEKQTDVVKVETEKEKVKDEVVKVGSETDKIKLEIVHLEPEREKVEDQTNKLNSKFINEKKEIASNQEHKPGSYKHEVSPVTENSKQNDSDVKLKPNESETVDANVVPKAELIDSKEESTTASQLNEINQLDLVSEEKSSDHSEISASESITSDVKTPPEYILTDKTKATTGTVNKPIRKVTSITNIKDRSRRASIAAVEGSKIEPPVKSTIPLIVKAQRRPSDSEAVIKKKVTDTLKTSELDAGATKPKVKTITRVKRPSVKSGSVAVNAITKRQSLTKVNENSAATTPILATTSIVATSNDGCGGDTITEANNSNKDAVPITSITSTTSTTTTNATAMPPVAILPTQLVIDDASLTITKTTEAAAAAATPPQNKATKDSRTATKLDELNDAVMVAALASPLRANEQNGGQATNAKQLTVLVGETIVIVPATTLKSADQLKKLENIDLVSNKISEIKIIRAESDVQISDTKLLPVDKIAKAETNQINSVGKIQVESTEIPGQTETSAQIVYAHDIKEPINQKIIPGDSLLQVQPNNQQVAAVAVVIPAVLPPTQIAKSDATPQITITTSATDAFSVSGNIDTATKASNTPTTSNSTAQTTASGTSAAPTTKKEEETIQTEAANMPELQVLQMPVKAVQVFGDHHQPKEPAPFNVLHKDEFPKKRVILKKLVRKSSTDKSAIKPVQTTKDKSKTHPPESVVSTEILLVLDDALTLEETATGDDVDGLTTVEEIEAAEALEPIVVEAPRKPKKPRTVKKKVIIKRQQRKLSISDTFFNAPAEDELKQPPPEVETVEKAIAYVTDDEDDDDEPIEPPKPLKTCMKLREYQVGDWVMYAERFKKTQVRWKKGRVMERITSISYLLDIDGKEVPAHISYIKKHTDRKVNFGGKEYLEIDYEQIAIEEQKARSYSIWNMV